MSIVIPNLRHLRAFCEVECTHNISKAADKIYLSQSAVTQGINKLSSILNAPLFTRSGSGVYPTTEAQAYAYRARRAFDLIEYGISEAIRISNNKPFRAANDVLHSLSHTQLKAFIAVGMTNNFSSAARQIGTSQPAVHRSIRELEHLIRVALFEKTTKGIVLTRAGQIVWQQCKLAVSELYQGYVDVKAVQNKQEGRIVIGAMPLARHAVLPEAIIEFSKTYPGIQIQVIEAPYPELLNELKNGEVDFLIGALRSELSTTDIIQTELFSSALCIAARKDHPLAKRKRLALKDLLHYPWVLPVHGTPTRERFEQMVHTHSLPTEFGLIESSSQVLIRGLLKGSDRLTIISLQQIQLEVELGLLTIIDYNIGDIPREIGVTQRTNWQPSQIHQEFFKHLSICARKYDECAS